MRDHKDELYSNKGNEIIQSYAWDLKEKQLKIMELLCSCYMTNYYDAEKNTITVGVSDFMRELGFSTTGISSREYKRFELAIQKLSDTSIIGIGFNGKRRIIRLINTADFPTKEGDTAIVCHMSEDFKECMKLQDRGNTKIEFRTICNMDSRYSIKLYNLLRSWQGKEDVYFDLDYLKELLNIRAKSYDNFAKFRQAVLDVAVNEINEKTSLQITYQGLKPLRGNARKITRVVFNIKHKKALPALPAAATDGEASDLTQQPEEDKPTDFELDLMDAIPQEVHQGEVERVRAVLDIANRYVAPTDFMEYYDADEYDTGATRLEKISEATRAAAEALNERILSAVYAYNNREYNVRKKNIRNPQAHYKYYLVGFEGWLLSNQY